MKKILILIISILLLQASIVFAQAQFRTDSNTVTTRIGNPPTEELACPIPKGVVTCGSKNVPVNGCGHCGVGYEAYMSTCFYEGIYYAMDIGGTPGQNIILPSVNGRILNWSFAGQSNVKNNQAVQQYEGTNTSTGDKYWIQFHHTTIGSGQTGNRSSGDIAAQICSNCISGSGAHVHVEFAKIETSGAFVWQDAPEYFCR